MMQPKPIGKRSILLFLAFVLIPFGGWAQNATAPYRMKTIVIDAGHGGKDPGNLGTGRYKTREKDVALDVALRVGNYINEAFPDIKVIYTRKTDVFIGLDGRAEVANDAKADLFMSIHCNAFSNPESNGVETFVLGLHRNKENLQVAMKENSAIFLEDDYKTKYEGFDPNSAESIIALTIMQSAYLQQSLTISSYIQEQFKSRVGRRDRGVKQAGFLVLRKTTMPSILIELGFLTNASEEDFLNSENGKAFMASAIFRGFKEYKDLVEDPLPETASAQTPAPTPTPAVKEPAPKPVVSKEADAKAVAAEKAKKQAQVARQDSIAKATAQVRLKVVADSLALVKQKLLADKEKRETELVLKAAAQQKAKLDSLENVKKEKQMAYDKRQKQLAEEQAREIADKKAKEDAAKKAEAEKLKKELAAKEKAKEWLGEIKEVKEIELEKAQQKAATDTEKERLTAIKAQREKELAEASHIETQQREKAEKDSITARKLIDGQARAEMAAQQKSIADKNRADSLAQVVANSEKLAQLQERQRQAVQKMVKERAVQDSIAALKKGNTTAVKEKPKAKPEVVTIDDRPATTAEEAELLFLQLRKKQLEQRIAQLKDQSVADVPNEKSEEVSPDEVGKKPAADASAAEGVRLRVQVLTSTTELPSDGKQFKGQKTWFYQQGGLYKYTIGETQDFDEITKLQGELRTMGFKDAFVVAFNNGERIKVSEARDLLK